MGSHFAPDPKNDTPMKKGDFVLIDLWAKEKKPGAIMADITWTATRRKSGLPSLSALCQGGVAPCDFAACARPASVSS